MNIIPIESFVQEQKIPIVDVRTPAEYASGHIPGAINIPLFSDEERHQVGTLYKQQGKEVAVKKGLEFVGPKLVAFVNRFETISSKKTLKIYCWRGGMRSSSMATLAEWGGFSVSVLQNGYKNYRGLLDSVFNPFQLLLIGGETGSGKTEVLHELGKMRQQTVDLEGLANHKGSAFGAIGQPLQPTNEHFQNLVISAFLKLDPAKPVFVEDESSYIGKVGLPAQLWKKMTASPIIRIKTPIEERIGFLVQEYGSQDPVHLESSIERISKKLGGLATKEAIAYLQEGKMAEVSKIVLRYYDKSYQYLLKRKESNILESVSVEHQDFSETARRIIQASKKLPALQS